MYRTGLVLSVYCTGPVLAVYCLSPVLSVRCNCPVLYIYCTGMVLSVYCTRQILSVYCTSPVLSVFCTGPVLSVYCTGPVLSSCTVLGLILLHAPYFNCNIYLSSLKCIKVGIRPAVNFDQNTNKKNCNNICAYVTPRKTMGSLR